MEAALRPDPASHTRITRRVLTLYGVFAAAVFALATTPLLTGQIAGMNIPLVIVYALPLTALAIAYRTSPAMREWMLALDVRYLMFFHVARWGGYTMLVTSASGMAALGWGISSGLGDMTAATALGTLAVIGFARRSISRRAVVFWNLFGIADAVHSALLAILFIPGRLGVLAGPTSATNAAAVLEFPLNLLPLVFVPFLFCCSIIVLLQMRKAPPVIRFSTRPNLGST